MERENDYNGKPTLLLKDNTDNFKDEIEAAFRGAINTAVVEIFRVQGHEITNWMAENTSGELYRNHILESFLKPFGIDGFVGLVKLMGGIVGDAKFVKLNEFKLTENNQLPFRDFVLTTDKYSLIRNFQFESKEVILNSSFIKITDENNYGASILSNQIYHASRAGFKYLLIDAERDSNKNGYYTWLMMGYLPLSNQGFDEQLESIVKGTEFEDIDSYIDLLKTEKGRLFWRENGFRFNGVFELNDESYSMAIFQKYLETRHLFVEDIKGELSEYHTEAQLDEIYGSFSNADLIAAQNKMDEHVAWKIMKLFETRERLKNIAEAAKDNPHKQDWYSEFETEAARYFELNKSIPSNDDATKE